MGKLIFHVDVNSAYLSWEAARRVANGKSDIRLISAVIGGDQEKRTGVVLAKSIPAKKFGTVEGSKVLDDLHIVAIVIKKTSFHIGKILGQVDLVLRPQAVDGRLDLLETPLRLQLSHGSLYLMASATPESLSAFVLVVPG